MRGGVGGVNGSKNELNSVSVQLTVKAAVP